MCWRYWGKGRRLKVRGLNVERSPRKADADHQPGVGEAVGDTSGEGEGTVGDASGVDEGVGEAVTSAGGVPVVAEPVVAVGVTPDVGVTVTVGVRSESGVVVVSGVGVAVAPGVAVGVAVPAVAVTVDVASGVPVADGVACVGVAVGGSGVSCLLYTSPSPRDS